MKMTKQTLCMKLMRASNHPEERPAILKDLQESYPDRVIQLDDWWQKNIANQEPGFQVVDWMTEELNKILKG